MYFVFMYVIVLSMIRGFALRSKRPSGDGLFMMISLPPQGTPPLNTAADMAHRTHSTQPALRPHRATPRAEDKPPHIYVSLAVSTDWRRLHACISLSIYIYMYMYIYV